jgi:parallel beta-helix repeat protein
LACVRQDQTARWLAVPASLERKADVQLSPAVVPLGGLLFAGGRRLVCHFDYQENADPGQCNGGEFISTNLSSGLDRTSPHTIKIQMWFLDGAGNDVVRVYVDGVLAHTGTSWEDYFRNCENNPTRPVDSLLFRTGGAAATATAGQGFVIDNLTLFSGPITQCTTTCYVDGVNGNDGFGGASPTEAKKTIQAAVNQVSAGGTVIVAAGSYAEQVQVSKAVMLQGAQVGIDGRTRCDATSGETILNGTGGAFYLQANDVTVNGFVIENATASYLGTGLYAPGSSSGHTIVNNVFRNNIFGLYLNGSNSTVEHNCFKNNNQPGAAAGNGIYSDQGAANLLVNENDFTGHENCGIIFTAVPPTTFVTGVTISGNQLLNDSAICLFNTGDSTVSGNTVDHSSSHGIYLGGNNTNLQIKENTLTNAASGFSGVRIRDDIGNSPNSLITIQKNLIQHNDYGVRLADNAVSANLVVNRNNLAENPIAGISNEDGDYSFNGECNWWGQASGPSGEGAGSGSAVTANVDFLPWLAISNLDGECGLASLTVVKVLQGDTPAEDWLFSGVEQGFSLPAAGGSTTFSELPAGEYTIVETAKAGYNVSVSCTNEAESTSNSITLTLAPGDEVTCTFTNTQLSTGINLRESDSVSDLFEGSNQPSGYYVSLRSQPTHDVLVTVSPDSQLTSDKTTLTFTPANWNVEQLVYLRAVDDTAVEGPHTGIASHSAASVDPNYNGAHAQYFGNGPDADNNPATIETNIADNDGNTQPIYLSLNKNGSLPGVGSYGDEDIVTYDPVGASWALFFDGSDVGLGATDLDAFARLSNGNLLFSTDTNFTLPGSRTVNAAPLKVDDADILEFVPTSPGSYGPNTTGKIQLYFDGSAHGLNAAGEDIDAIAFDSGNNLIISVTGAFSAPGATGGDEDLFRWTGSSWEHYFDGSSLALTASSEDLVGLWLDGSTQYMSFLGNFKASSSNPTSKISGKGSDILICLPTSMNPVASCEFRMFFNGATVGLANQTIDGLDVGGVLSIVTGANLVDEAPSDDTDDPEELDGTETADEGEEEQELAPQLFLPLVLQ